MTKVYVVIPHYNNWALTHSRLNELHKYCKNSVTEVLVVDNGSTDGGTKGGLEWWSKFPSTTDFKVRAIRVEENIGFLLASNLGISDTVSKCEPDDIIILLSNDVEIRTNFVSQVTDIISHTPESLVGGVLYTHDTGWNVFGEKIFPYIEGWLLAMTSTGWGKAEWGFDERFAPCIFEDVDLSTHMLTLGYELVPLNNPGLHHLKGQTIKYTPERDELTRKNKEKFRLKWIGENSEEI